MYIAELHGKISHADENMEDILTSNIFSFFKYTDRRIFLYRFLKARGLEISPEDATRAEFFFWPSFSNSTQPDLVLIVGQYYLVIEAKFRSGFGEETRKIKHQLIREIEGGKLEAKEKGKKLKIIIVTADYYFRKEQFSKIPEEYQTDLIWVNWQTIAWCIADILQSKIKLPVETGLFAKDLYELLLKKRLRNFEGIKALISNAILYKYEDRIFFNASTAIYRGDFIGFLPALETIRFLPDLSLKEDLFFQAYTSEYRGDFIGFLPTLDIIRLLSDLKSEEYLFFQSKTSQYRGDFIGFLPAMETSCVLPGLITEESLFFHAMISQHNDEFSGSQP